MSDKNNNPLNEGYIPKLVPIVDDSNSKFGYQPAKSSGNNQPQQTISPPKKP